MKLDDPLYVFLTQPENFEPFADLQSQYNDVRIRLINEFWELVFQFVIQRKEEVPEWEFYIDTRGIEFRKVGATHKEAINTKGRSKIVYEFLDKDVILGIWINRISFDGDALKRMRDAASKFIKDKHPWQLGNGNLWYTILKRPGLNLQQKSSLMEILPARRRSLANQYADDLIAAIKDLGEFCISQANM